MTLAQEPRTPRTRARLPWAFVPVVLLVTSALGVGSMAVVAARDPHFATEADYYQKAIRWDRTQAQAAENQRLDYRFDVPKTLAFDRQGRATLELTLHDAAGQPVSGARLQAEAFANAYSADIYQLSFSERGPGVYTAQLQVRHAGMWVFRVTAQSGAQQATADLRTELVFSGAA